MQKLVYKQSYSSNTRKLNTFSNCPWMELLLTQKGHKNGLDAMKKTGKIAIYSFSSIEQ